MEIEAGMILTADMLNAVALTGRPIGHWQRVGNQSIEATTNVSNATAIAWDSTVFDEFDSRMDPPDNSQIRPTRPGLYTFIGGVGMGSSSSGTVRGTAWRKNGDPVEAGSSRPHVTGDIADFQIEATARTITVEMDGEEDYVELCGLQNSGSSLNVNSGVVRPYLILVYSGELP